MTPQQHGPVVAAPPGNQPGQQAWQRGRLPSAVGDRGGIYPRWPFLAALFLAPTLVVGYGIEEYFASHVCSLGWWCGIDLLPGPMQAFIIWLTFLLLWLIAFVFGVGPLEIRLMPGAGSRAAVPSGPIGRFFFAISDVRRMSHLLMLFGGMALVGLIVGYRTNRFTPVAFAVGAVVIVVAVCSTIWSLQPHPPQRLPAQYVRRMSYPSYIFRTLPIIDHIWPPRPPTASP